MRKRLILWLTLNDTLAGSNLIREEIDIFTKNYKIPVEIIEIPWGKMWEYIINSIKEDYQPDVIQIGNSWISILSEIKYLEKLPGIINENDLIFNISPRIKKSFYAIPWFLDISLLFYNKEKISLENMEVNSLLKECRKNSKQSLIIGGKKENVLLQYLSEFIWLGGGEYISKDKINLLEDKNYKGIKNFFNTINQCGIKDFLLDKYGDNIVEFFLNERGTFTMANSWTIRTFIKEYKKEKKFMVLPFNGEYKCNFIGGSCLGIIKKSKLKKEAIQLIKFLTSYESQKRYISNIGMIPANKEAFNKTISNFIYKEEIKKAIKNGRTYPGVPYWGSVEKILVEFIYEMFKLIKIKKYSEKKLYNNLKFISEKIEFLIDLWSRN